MKKFLGIVVLGLLLSGNAYAKIIELKKCSYGDKKFNYWLQTIIIHKKYKSKVDKILNQLIKNGFNLRKGWELMTSINYLKKYPIVL